jgi:hypothetical protein
MIIARIANTLRVSMAKNYNWCAFGGTSVTIFSKAAPAMVTPFEESEFRITLFTTWI